MSLASRRQKRAADLVKKEISQIIQSEIRDPRVGFVTVTTVDVSPDLHNAKVFCHVHGSEKQRRDSLIGLKHAASHIRSELAARTSLRYVPSLHFHYDEGLDRYERIDSLLKGLSGEHGE